MIDDGVQPLGPGAAARAKANFATTHWSLVRRAGADGSEEARGALDRLVESYWYPLYAFARRKGYDDHDAMDLTQGFVAQLLDGRPFGSVSPEKGRFRAFLSVSFSNYIAKHHRAGAAVRRGGATVTFSLTAADSRTRYDVEPVEHETPESLFERSWVESLLSKVQARLAGDYRAAGKGQLFDLLEPHLEKRGDAAPLAEVSRQLKLSAAAVAMSLHRMRRRYGELLREEVALTVDDPAEVEQELRELMEIVARSS